MDLLIRVLQREKYYLKRPHELLGLLGDYQRETDELSKAEIREALEELSEFTFHERSADSKFWEEFVPSVEQNLQWIKDADDGVVNKQVGFLHDELQWIHRYLVEVHKSLRGSSRAIHAFSTHVASVVLRIAFQSCNFWFNRTEPETSKVKATALVGLHQEINPANPEFLKLNLRFQEALYQISSQTNTTDFVGHFCSYLLIWLGKEDVRKELMSLVNFLINITLVEDDSSGEDVHSFFAEINAVLAEAAFLHREVQRRNSTISYPTDLTQYIGEDLPPCSELLTNICLLKAEIFLKEQNTRTSEKLFSNNQFFRVDMILENLRAFIQGLCQQDKTEYVKQSLVLVEEIANELESLHISLHSGRITYSWVKHSLVQLLFKIVFFKAESFLTNLLKSSDASICHEKDQIESLAEELKYLKRVVTNKLARNSSDEEIVITQVEGLARGITLLSYSFLPDNEKFKKMILSLPQLLEKVKIIKAKLGEISQQFPKYIFPTTSELGFIDILCRNIRELLKHDPESIAPVKHHIKEVQLHLESLKSFLVKVKDSEFEMGELNDLGNHIIDVAHKLEYVVELIEVDGHLQQSLWLCDLLEDIRLVDQKACKISEMFCTGKGQDIPQISRQMTFRDTTPGIDELVVDLVDEEEAIIKQLIGGLPQKDVVSIVGMPGIGKTTLARKVYNNRNVRCHFHYRGWCTISQMYSKRELLLDVFSHIHVLTDDIRRLNDDDLQLELYRKLLRKNYLIVIDNVSDIVAWNDLKHSFPDDSNGSRILITSCHQDVASEIKPESDPHSIRLLSDDESWILLEKKIFKGDVFPEILLQVGKEIAQQCQGLPLAVVTIAGVLQQTERSQDCWRKILKSLSSGKISDPKSRCEEILELSYKHLPEYLKACFLYMGVFLGDKDIPVSKLIRFWMAEGFIQEFESKTLEEVAEDYLLKLINRSLVNISKTRSNGKVKTCRLHDLLRDLCCLKAKEENFLQLVKRHDKPYASFPDSDYGKEFDISNQLAPTTFESYRLSFYLERRYFIDCKPSGLGARFLIFFASIDSEPKCPYEISFICHNFKLLRILDLECIMASSFPVEIGLMVQLRYIAVSGYMQSVPPSIANLWKLETLVVRGLRSQVILPETIWSLARLRHLHVNNHVTFSWHGLDEQVGSSFHLENLVSFSTPSFSCGEDTLRIFKRLPNLRKLRCIFLQSLGSSEDCNGLQTLQLLTNLESLKMIYYGGALNSGGFILPLNLKKLTLVNFSLKWNHLSMIGQLPNLRVLKLLAGAFGGQTWDMKEEEFKQLKFLELDTTNIVEWNASYHHFPSLERIIIRNCKDLERIPSDFFHITTLQMIEVQWCSQSVEASTQEIGHAKKEIKVLISRL